MAESARFADLWKEGSSDAAITETDASTPALDEAERQAAEVGTEPQELVADKGYYSNKTMTGVKERKLRSYVSEPNRGPRKWKRNRDAQKPTCDNRRRIRGNRGKQLLRQRGEKLERGFAHLLVTGGLRLLPENKPSDQLILDSVGSAP